MTEEKPGPCLFPPSGNLHPECVRMHAQGFCICTTVECIWCDHNHPPHKECVKQEKP